MAEVSEIDRALAIADEAPEESREREIDRALAISEGKKFDEDNFAAEFVGQKELAPSDSPIGLRAILSIFGDTFEEKQDAHDFDGLCPLCLNVVVNAARELSNQAEQAGETYQGKVTIVLNFNRLDNALKALDNSDAQA